MNRRTGSLSVLAVAAALAAGCAQKLQPPSASIAAAGKVATGAVVQLDGEKSADPQGLPLAFKWQMLNLPPGSQAALNDTAVVNPSFTADVDGTYVVQLVVSDGKLSSGPATATVIAGPCGDEPLVVAPEGSVVSAIGGSDGGVDAGIPTGALVQLHATVTDPNAACLPGADAGTAETFTYAWSFLSVPSGSAAKLDGDTLQAPSFVADVPGSYVVGLTAKSPAGISGQGTTTVVAGTCGNNPPQIQEIGAQPASANVGQLVQLSSRILQPDNAAPCNAGETLAYAWSFVALPAGSRAKLNSSTVEQPSFVPDVAGAYAIRLEVTDSLGHVAAPQTLAITVGGCGGAVPAVSVLTATPALPDTGQTIQLSAMIADADATVCGLVPSYTYSWQIVGQPPASHAALNNPAASDPSFTADVPGGYDVALVVTKVELSPGAGPVPGAGADGGLSEDGGTGGDAGSLDAGLPDAGNSDAGGLSTDGGAPDSGPGSDAGAGADAGTGEPDAGLPAGPVPLGHPIASAMAFLHIQVSTCGSAAPSVTANADPQPDVGQTVKLGVATISDANAQSPCEIPESFTYAWSIEQLPKGSSAALNGTSLVAPSFTPDVAGEYDFIVAVTDSSGKSGFAVETVTAQTCGSASPTVVASAPAVTGAVPVGQPVQLLATAKDDDALSPCNLPVNLTYAWQLIEVPPGSRAQLNDPSATNPSFTPDVASGAYKAVVTVTDQHGRTGVSAPVEVDTGTCGTLAPAPNPVVASPAGTLDVGSTVQLSVTTQDGNRGDGCTGESCCALAETETYSWWFTELPPGSHAQLNGASLQNPSFVPDVPAVGQTVYEVAVAATDSSGLTGVATLDIHVSSCGDNPPVIVPASFTSTPEAPVLGQPTRIAAAFTDADNEDPCSLGRTFTYHWTMDRIPAGSHATIDDPEALAPSFTPDVAGVPYGFSFTVTDNLGRSATSPEGAFVVTAQDCGRAAPTISLPSLSTATFQAVQLGADPGGNPLPVGDANTSCASAFPNAQITAYSYAWSLVSVPAGSRAKLNDSTAATPSFLPDVAGPATYTARVVITDGLGNQSAPTTQTVNVTTCGDAPAVPYVNTSKYPVVYDYCSGAGGSVQSAANCLPGSGTSADNPCSVKLVSGESTCPLNNVLVLDALGTTDADITQSCNPSETLSYKWQLFAVPPGSNAQLVPGGETSATATPWVQLDQTGDYVFRLYASDGTPAPASPPAVFYVQAN